MVTWPNEWEIACIENILQTLKSHPYAHNICMLNVNRCFARSLISPTCRHTTFSVRVKLPAFLFGQDGFDLDLKYVTKRIIVHGVPRANAGKECQLQDHRNSLQATPIATHYTAP